MLKRCLVTGGTGFLGRRIVRSLEARGCEVTTLGRSPAGGRHVVADLGAGAVDLRGVPYEAVYHAAGLAHFEPRDEAGRRLFETVNVEGTRALLEGLERCSALPRSLLLVSTVAVYGASEGWLLDESTPRRATDPYGLSRLRAEDLAQEWGARHGVRTSIVRLPLVAGPVAPGNLGRMVRAIAAGRYLGIGAGGARRSMVRAADVAEVLPAIAAAGGVFHLTDGEHPSFAELEAGLAAALGRRPCPRLPLVAARALALAGDALETVSRRPAPFNGRALAKMTSTLTFSDQRARETVAWAPARVLERVGELVAAGEPDDGPGGTAQRDGRPGHDQAGPDAGRDE